MSGHNKWSTIKHKKAAVDAKRGKIFSRFAKEITMAAREGGGDPEINARLRTAINAAKSGNVPNDNIERAIKKGTGDLQGTVLDELVYEGYAPGGVAVLITALSDNRNRTAANIRSYFTKNNANIANGGAVAWMFQRKTRFLIEGEHANEDKLLELLLEADVNIDDLSVSNDSAEIVAPPESFNAVVSALEGAGIAISESGLVMIPENKIAVQELGIARQVMRLVDILEDDDDVQEVYTNIALDDDLMEQLAAE